MRQNNFISYADFERQLSKISSSKEWKEIEVEKPEYSKFGFIEKWYFNEIDNSTWRLVEPDNAFRGKWEKTR